MTESRRYLSFEIDAVEYAIQALAVREIVALPPITRVPNASEHVRGVANLRGRILPIVDLRILLGVGAPRESAYAPVIVVDWNGGNIGLVVDHVRSILDVEPRQVRSAAHVAEGLGARLIENVADLGDRSPLLLNPDRLTPG